MRVFRRRTVRPASIALGTTICGIIFLVYMKHSSPSSYLKSKSNLADQKNLQALAKPALPRPHDLDLYGLGEGGTAVRLSLNVEDQKKADEAVKTYAVNQFVSEKISLHRTLKDKRHQL